MILKVMTADRLHMQVSGDGRVQQSTGQIRARSLFTLWISRLTITSLEPRSMFIKPIANHIPSGGSFSICLR
jgi:hypothetical protein